MSLHTDPTIDQIFKFSDSSSDGLDVEPVYANKKTTNAVGDYAALRDWVTSTHTALADPSQMRAYTQIKNLALWLGLHYQSQSAATGDFKNRKGDDVSIDSHRVIVNNIYDVERNRYSKISRNQPQTKAVPGSADYDDFSGSRIADVVLKTAKKNCRQRNMVNKMLRESFIFGESWIRCIWDKDKGRVDPRWEEKVKRLGKDEKRRYFMIDGEKVLIDREKPIFIGDHALKTFLPWQVFTDLKNDPEEVEWLFTVEYVHVDALKRDYPRLRSRITAIEDGCKQLNTGTLKVETLRNHCQVFELWCRSTKYLPNGLHFKCTADVTLEAPEDNPYPRCDESEWGNIPFERLTDIDVPGRLHGYSTIQILANLQHSENQMTTMIKHLLLMMGHPKILVPAEGKIVMDELSDGSFYVKYTGGHAPSLLVPNPVPPQVVQFAEYCRDKIQKLGDLHGVSSGDLPNNVRAARAIRLLQEMEDLRATSIFGKYNDIYLALDRKLLLQTKNYRDTDKRLANLLGKGNEYLVEDFSVEDLDKNIRVELELSGMLPQQPSARAEFITEMYQQTSGQLFSQEKWVKLLGFESEQEFLDASTVSVVKAQRENDRIIKGKKVEIPEPHENHLVELREHATLLQSVNFERMPKAKQEVIKKHVKTHEYLMYLHMQVNPVFKEMVLTTCPWFPLVFKMPVDTMAQMGSPGAVQQRPEGGRQAQMVPQPQPGAAAPKQPQPENTQQQMVQ